MRQPFGSYSEYSGDEILGQANFDNPYGVMEYAHEEINRLPTDNLSVAMQKALAETFARSYGERSQALMDVMPFTTERQIQNEFLKSPVDISGIGNAKIGDTTFNEMYPSLKGVQTYGDIANVLYASNVQGIVSAAKMAASNRKDFGPSIGTADDIIGQGTLHFYDAMFTYQPGKSEFTKYAQSSVFNGLTAYYRDQAGIARMQGGSLESLVNASPDTFSDEGAFRSGIDGRLQRKRLPHPVQEIVPSTTAEQDARVWQYAWWNRVPGVYKQSMDGFGNTSYRGGSSANARLVFPTGSGNKRSRRTVLQRRSTRRIFPVQRRADVRCQALAWSRQGRSFASPTRVIRWP